MFDITRKVLVICVWRDNMLLEPPGRYRERQRVYCIWWEEGVRPNNIFYARHYKMCSNNDIVEFHPHEGRHMCAFNRREVMKVVCRISYKDKNGY